jgi:hypothetical protein
MHSRDDLPPLPTVVSVHPSQIAIYKDLSCLRGKSLYSLKKTENLKSNVNRNKLSPQAKRKLNRSIDYLLYTATSKTVTSNKKKSKFTFKVAFITLTLAAEQTHSDQLITSQLLNQFLTEAKKKWGLNKYVWKKEYQKNGNLHYHILTDKFIPYNELRNTWNRIQNKLGYVTDYMNKHHKVNPNSTDVHSLHKVKNVKEYISKYMAKSMANSRVKMNRVEANFRAKKLYTERSVSDGALSFLRKASNNGRIWGCSYNLTDLKGGRSEVDSYISAELNKICEHKATRVYKKDHFSCLFFDSSLLNRVQFPELYNLLQSFISQHIEPQQQSIVFNEYLPPNSEFDYQTI